jgi:hypothetical protein
MIQYFEKYGASKCPQHVNPAEYMLDAFGAGDPNRHGKDWGQVWIESGECRQRMEESQGFIRHRGQVNPSQLVDDRRFAMPWTIQVATVIKRTVHSHWRSPEYYRHIRAP